MFTQRSESLIVLPVEYKLSMSIGYAVYGTEAIQTVDQSIEATDSQMYQMKERRHAKQDNLNKNYKKKIGGSDTINL